MYSCKIENEYGERLTLTNNKSYRLYKIDGLEPPTAIINTSQVANYDGARFNSSKTNMRNIVIYMTIEGDCEVNRINLYRYVKSKRPIRFYYKNSSRDVYIDGYVEEMQIAFFDIKQIVQISILCPDPYFKSVKENIMEFTSVISQFHYPFAYDAAGDAFSKAEIGIQQSMINNGDIENGIVVTLLASGRALNPKVYNFTRNEYFILNMEMLPGDKLVINTNKTRKSVLLTRNGVTTSVINTMERGSKWFQLYSGDNLFSYGADEYPEHLSCTITHLDEFEGV